jgi:hypothetical protein
LPLKTGRIAFQIQSISTGAKSSGIDGNLHGEGNERMEENPASPHHGLQKLSALGSRTATGTGLFSSMPSPPGSRMREVVALLPVMSGIQRIAERDEHGNQYQDYA